MKEVNGIPVYKEEDMCALDEYSKQLEEALTPKFQNIEDNLIESAEKILELEKESNNQKDTTELLNLQVEELKNENTQLKNQIPTGTAEGESIYLSDSSDLEAKIIVKGNSRQATRTNNLYNNLTNTSGFMGQSGDIVSNTGWVVTDFIPVISSIKYYIAGNKFYTEGSGVYGGFYNSEKELLATFSYSDYRNETSNITIPEGASYIRFSLYKYQDNTLSFDFYTDSINPNYPSTVETVGSNVNEFDESKYSEKTINSRTLSFNKNGNIVINGTSSSPSNFEQTISITPTKDTYISITQLGGSFEGGEVQFILISEDGSSVKSAVINISSNKASAKLDSNIAYKTARISIRPNVSCNNLVIGLKIEQGTKATSYSPYNQGSVEIDVVNKNWFDFNNNYLENAGIDSTGKIISSSYKVNYCKVKSGETYTLSRPTSMQYVVTTTKNEPKINEQGTTRIVTISKDYTITIPEGYNYICIRHIGNGNEDNIDLQIELGETATEKVEHQSQTKILPIQEEMLEDDYIADIEYHTKGKYVFTGNETIYLDDVYNGIAQFRFSLPNSYQDTTKLEICAYSNYFKGTPYQYTEDNTICSRYDVKFYRIMTSKFSTVEQFKTWLQEKYNSGNPVVVHYKLATPKSLPLTEEQKNILNKKTYTYKNITNINTNSIAILDVTYKKDLEILFNQVNQVLIERS